MRDNEAFTYFLGGRLHKLLFNSAAPSEYGSSGLCIEFDGQQQQIEQIIYTYFRCALLHEGRLPDNVDFVDHNSELGGPPSASISLGGRLTLDAGWIDLVFQAVVHAQVNGPEFGIEHRFLRSRNNVDDGAFGNQLILMYDLTLGRINILKNVVVRLAGTNLENTSFEDMALYFRGLVEQGNISLGSLNGLMGRDLVDAKFQLTPKGGQVIRDIAMEYEVVVI